MKKKLVAKICVFLAVVVFIFQPPIVFAQSAAQCSTNPACVAMLAGQNNIVPLARTAISTGATQATKSATITRALAGSTTSQTLSWQSALGFGGLIYGVKELLGLNISQESIAQLQETAFQRYAQTQPTTSQALGSYDPLVDPYTCAGGSYWHYRSGNYSFDVPFTLQAITRSSGSVAASWSIAAGGTAYFYSNGKPECGSLQDSLNTDIYKIEDGIITRLSRQQFNQNNTRYEFVSIPLTASNFSQLTPAQKDDAVSLLTDEEISPSIVPVKVADINLADGEVLTSDVPLYLDGTQVDSITGTATGDLNFDITDQEGSATGSSTTNTTENTDGSTTTTTTEEFTAQEPDFQCKARFQQTENFLTYAITGFTAKFPFDIVGDAYNTASQTCLSFTLKGRTIELCELSNLLAKLKWFLTFGIVYRVVLALG